MMIASAVLPWKILIVDDDADVHVATRMALRGVDFRGRPLEFIDAYSGAQVLELLQQHPDTALVFLDVMMETDDAGLQVARRIRESGFKLVRIIVRTGFPGQAPERQVIVDFDIHDYKEKTGLSVQKLFTSVISALRAYDDMVALEDHRRGLLGVLEAASSFDFNSVHSYVSRMLAEFTGLARLGSDTLIAVFRTRSVAAGVPTVLASFGNWQELGEATAMQDLPPDVAALVQDSLDRHRALSGSGGKTVFFHHRGVDLVVFAAGESAFAQVDEVLLEMFLVNVCRAIGNHQIFSEMVTDRNAVLRALALRGERWDENAAVELDRLSRLATGMATRLHTTLDFAQEIDSRFIQCIGIAAMLHDLGNDAILTSLLSKNTCYEPHERQRMQAHVAAGVKLVDGYLVDVGVTGALGLARDIIGAHHEHFDGSGYPNGLGGESIPLSARLVAVADAYVAMTSARPHRVAMDAVTAQMLIKNGAGRQFDPRMVEAFFDVVANGFGN